MKQLTIIILPKPLVEIAAIQSARGAIRIGRFQFDDDSIGEFVLIQNGLQEILNALQIHKNPELMIFAFPENFGVVPNENFEDTKLYRENFLDVDTSTRTRNDLKFPDPKRDYVHIHKIESRVRNVLDGISRPVLK